MRDVRRILGLVTTATLVLCFTPLIVSAAPAKPRAERPTYTLGEKWIRDDGTYELVRIEEDRYIFVAGADREIQLTKDLAIAKVRRGEIVWECTPPRLSWPLEVGKSGTSHGSLTRSGLRSEFVEIAWNVEAYEAVRVPAGMFQAFRIEMDLHTIGTHSPVSRFRMWYASEARQYVKVSGPSLTEHGAAPSHVFHIVPANAVLLQIDLDGPADQAHVASASLSLKGTVTGGNVVMRVVVTLNGREVVRHDTAPGTAPREVPLAVSLPLQEGRNILLVTATDAVGVVQQESRTLFYDPPAPPRVARRPANHWAVVVGVGRHDHPQIPRLRYAVPDAEAIHRVLISPAGFKPEHVLLLTDTSERKPTYRNLKWALGTFLARSAQKDDTCSSSSPATARRRWTSGAWSGTASRSTSSRAMPTPRTSTLPPSPWTSSRPSSAGSNRSGWWSSWTPATAGPPGAGPSPRRRRGPPPWTTSSGSGSPGPRVARSSPPPAPMKSPWKSPHTVTASSPTTSSRLSRAMATSTATGSSPLQELYEYVEQEVGRISRALGGNQHPVLKGELEGVLPLVKVPAPRP